MFLMILHSVHGAPIIKADLGNIFAATQIAALPLRMPGAVGQPFARQGPARCPAAWSARLARSSRCLNYRYCLAGRHHLSRAATQSALGPYQKLPVRFRPKLSLSAPAGRARRRSGLRTRRCRGWRRSATSTLPWARAGFARGSVATLRGLSGPKRTMQIGMGPINSGRRLTAT